MKLLKASLAVGLVLVAAALMFGQISGTTPQLTLRETDQALPNGLYRVRVDADSFSIEKNTSITGNFGTYTTIFVSGGGPANAPVDATYLTQIPNATLTNEQAMSTLGTGLVKNTTGTGVQSIAVAGVDYEPGLTFSTGLTRTVNTITVDHATVPFKSDNLSVFAATTSAQLAGIITDETGTGVLVFDTSPTFTTQLTSPVVKLSASSAQLVFQSGGTTGTMTWAPSTSNKTLTWPNGTTDFTVTGGTSQVLKQTSTGGAFTVARLACADLSDSGTSCTLGTGVTSLTATANQTTVSGATGAVTVGTVQNIGTTSSPTHANLTLSDAASPALTVTDTTTPATGIFQAQNTTVLFGSTTNHLLQFITNNANVMSLDNVGSLVVNSTGPHVMGGVANANVQLAVLGNWAPAGTASSILINSSITAATNQYVRALSIQAAIAEATGGTGTHPELTNAYFGPSFSGTAAATTDAINVDIATFTAPSGTTTASGIRVVAPGSASTNWAINSSGRVNLAAVTTSAAATSSDACFSTNEIVKDSALCIVSARRFKHDVIDVAFGVNANRAFNDVALTAAAEDVQLDLTPAQRGLKMSLPAAVIPTSSATDLLMKLRPVNYFLNEPSDLNQSRQQFGYIAEEVAALDHRLVTYQSDGQIRSVLYISMIPVLNKGFQEHDQRISQLEQRIATLEAQLAK